MHVLSLIGLSTYPMVLEHTFRCNRTVYTYDMSRTRAYNIHMTAKLATEALFSHDIKSSSSQSIE